MKTLLRWFIEKSKPWAWRLAAAYDIRVDRPCYAYGQHELVIAGDREQAMHNIPKSVYFNTRSGRILVGENTVFGEDVKVLTGKHMHIEEARTHGVAHHHVPESGRDIHIGTGCYIGSGAIIIGPIEIGDYAVIGAGSVVTRDIPPYAFAAGVPARILKTLVPAAQTE